MGMFLENLSWNAVRECLQENYLPVLPVGAACKEHGFHLPMNTDIVQIQWLMEGLVKESSILVWPTVNYGYYPAFKQYSGSVSLSRKTFMAVITEIVDGILYHGADKIVVVNSGVSTIPVLVELSLSKAYAGKIHVCNIYQGSRYQQARRSVSEQRNGGHADEVETSLMLAIDSGSVDLTQAQSEDTMAFTMGPLQFSNADAVNYSISGAMGNPTLASRDKGYELLNAMYHDVRVFLEHVLQIENNSNHSHRY